MEANNKVIVIPKASFTAFRLSYASSYELSHLSRCELIGGIPKIWWDTKSLGILQSTKSASRKVKKKYKQTKETVNDSFFSHSHSLRSNSISSGVTKEDVEEDDEFKLNLKGENLIDIVKIMKGKRGEYVDDEDSKVKNPLVSIDPNEPAKYYPNNELSSDPNREVISVNIDVNAPNLLRNPFDKSRELGILDQLNEKTSIYDRKVSKASNSLYLLPTNYSRYSDTASDVHVFSPMKENLRSRKSSDRRKASILTCQEPEPEEHYLGEKLLKDKRQIRKKIKEYARAGKGKTKQKTANLKVRIANTILRQYKDGEVFRVEKMLVLIKEVWNKQVSSKFNEQEQFDSRIYERWREYLVILRKSDDPNNPILIQFKDLDSSDKLNPEFSLYINELSSAQFYSDFDKSICITSQKDNSSFMYILRSRDQVTSFRWLYFIRQMLGYEDNKLFNIHIPDISIDLKISISYLKLITMLEADKHMSIKVLDKGYDIKYCTLIQYLKETINSELKDMHKPHIDEWLERNKLAWFCFKLYDRLEWAPNNSNAFYIQHQLLFEKFELNLRSITPHIETIIDGEGKMEEPVPIEGFLSRLSDNLGKEKKIIRNFYQLLYFYSNDNLLFFMKYYRAVPPSPDNILMNNPNEERKVQFPIVFEKSPFPINEFDHITWLNENQEEFEINDHIAMCEFERRAQQVIKAEAMIDMCQVKQVEAISHESISRAQKLAHCILWYSNGHLIDDLSVVNSGFVIKMNNGSTLKLQAPDQTTRDIWVKKLNDLKRYWDQKMKNTTKRILDIRDQNIKNLKINEYIDSNIYFESELLNIKTSLADPYIHSIKSLAMSRSIVCSGYLFQKSKKHSNFNRFFVVLCPGFLMLFSIYKRSRTTGVSKNTTSFTHYLTVPLSDCYVYSGDLASLDLLENTRNRDPGHPGQNNIPRIYSDGWKSSEEEYMRCFTLWFGKKKQISQQKDILLNYNLNLDQTKNSRPKNPNSIKLAAKLGITGKSIVFMARSRQEREIWVLSIFSGSNRLV